jgi:hypothetical protein
MSTFIGDDQGGGNGKFHNINNPRINLNTNMQNKRGKLPIDVGERLFWMGQAMGCASQEHIQIRHTPKEKLTREFLIHETNRYLTDFGMPTMNVNETALFIFYMTKYIEMQKRKKLARMDSFMKDVVRKFGDK